MAQLSSSQIEQMIRDEATRQGIDPNLAVAVAKTESSLNPNAVSGAGAQGVFQLMPNTAAGLGVSDPFDPTQNIQGGVSYLGQLLNQYNGDTTLALAAYNAGPANVDKYGGVPPFQETQSYITKVLKWIGLSTPEPTTLDVTQDVTPVDTTAGMLPSTTNDIIIAIVLGAVILAAYKIFSDGGSSYD